MLAPELVLPVVPLARLARISALCSKWLKFWARVGAKPHTEAVQGPGGDRFSVDVFGSEVRDQRASCMSRRHFGTSGAGKCSAPAGTMLSSPPSSSDKTCVFRPIRTGTLGWGTTLEPLVLAVGVCSGLFFAVVSCRQGPPVPNYGLPP